PPDPSAVLAFHPEHADRPAVDQAAGKCRLLHQHQGVERVAIIAEGALDEAVVSRVLGRGEPRPVRAHPAGRVVDLVLVALTLGNLNSDVKVQHRAPLRTTSKPDLQLVSPTLRRRCRGWSGGEASDTTHSVRSA